VVRDDDGTIYTTVRYEAVNAMLLNEFLKEHRKLQALQAEAEEQGRVLKQQEARLASQQAKIAEQEKEFHAKLAQQHKRIRALAAGLQKVNARMESSNPAPRIARKE
jgi:septal ring factor EnvC (AmiA/AmiB activator)